MNQARQALDAMEEASLRVNDLLAQLAAERCMKEYPHQKKNPVKAIRSASRTGTGIRCPFCHDPPGFFLL